MLLTGPHPYFQHFSAFWHTRYSRVTLSFPLFSTGIKHFSKKNQDMGTRYAHCYQGIIASRPSQVDRVWKYTKCTHTCMQKYLNFCTYPYLSITDFMLIPMIPLKLYSINFSLPLFLFVTPFSNSERPGFHYLHLFVCLILECTWMFQNF